MELIIKLDEILLSTLNEANTVLEQLFALIMQYDFVTVGELYQLVGLTGNYKDDQIGWNDLSKAQVIHLKEGYLLSLPIPKHRDH